MTTIYGRATADETGLHFDPDYGVGGYDLVQSGGEETGNHICNHTVYLYDSGGSTLIGSNVAATTMVRGIDFVVGGGWYYATKTNTWTPAAQSSLEGGTSLCVYYNLYIGATFMDAAYVFSGPLVCTGISATQWTFSNRHASNADDYYDDIRVITDMTVSYISGITLTGDPDTVRLYTSSINAPWSATTRGTWNTYSGGQRWLGMKVGGYIGTGSSESVATNPYNFGGRCHISLPFVQGYEVSDVETCTGLYESNADADFYSRVHAFVAASSTSTPTYTLLDNDTDSTEVGTSASTSGVTHTASSLSVSIAAGDVVVLERGIQSQNSHTTSRTGYMPVGLTSSTDLTDGGDAGSYPGWLELTLGAGGNATSAAVTLGSLASSGSLSQIFDTSAGVSLGTPAVSASAAVANPRTTSATPTLGTLATSGAVSQIFGTTAACSLGSLASAGTMTQTFDTSAAVTLGSLATSGTLSQVLNVVGVGALGQLALSGDANNIPPPRDSDVYAALGSLALDASAASSAAPRDTDVYAALGSLALSASATSGTPFGATLDANQVGSNITVAWS